MDIWAQRKATIFTLCDGSVLNTQHRAAIILFFVLLFRFVADLPNHPDQSPAVKGKEFVDILIVAVTVIVVAIPGQ